MMQGGKISRSQVCIATSFPIVNRGGPSDFLREAVKKKKGNGVWWLRAAACESNESVEDGDCFTTLGFRLCRSSWVNVYWSMIPAPDPRPRPTDPPSTLGTRGGQSLPGRR